MKGHQLHPLPPMIQSPQIRVLISFQWTKAEAQEDSLGLHLLHSFSTARCNSPVSVHFSLLSVPTGHHFHRF